MQCAITQRFMERRSRSLPDCGCWDPSIPIPLLRTERSGCICRPVEKAVAGRVLVFRDAKKERAIRELLTETEKSVLSDRIGMIDVRDEQNIQMNCDGTYRLTFGSGTDAGLKLRMANKTISDSLFETGMLAKIDLSVTGVASVQYDLRLDLSAVD